MSTRAILGKGWRFPVLPDEQGALDYSDGPDKIAQSIQIIIETEPGERIMRSSFGCGLRRYLMRPNTNATRAQRLAPNAEDADHHDDRSDDSKLILDPLTGLAVSGGHDKH